MDLTTLMDGLLQRLTAADLDGVAEMCAPDCRFKQNTGVEGGLDELLGLIGGISAAGVKVSYSDIRRVIGDQSATEQHLVTLRRADGMEASTDVCVVVHFGADGRIVRIDEYLDGSALAPLFG